jgi:hypothetical protein
MLKAHKYFFILFLTLVIITLSLSDAKSQDTLDIKNRSKVTKADLRKMKPVNFILKTNILPLIRGPIPNTGEYRLAAEFLVGKKSSITASAAYLGKSLLFMIKEKASLNLNNGTQKMTINGYRVQGGYKYYLYNKPYTLKGVFVSPNVSYASSKFYYKSYPSDYLKMIKFQANLLIGGQIAIANRYCLEIFFGPGFKINRAFETYNGQTQNLDTQDMGIIYNTNFSIVMGFNFGIAL